MVAPSAAPEIFPTQAPAPGWLTGKPGVGTITWTGCAGFLFDVEGTRICVDPFVSNPGFVDAFFRPARPNAALVRQKFPDVAAAFIGHSHWDHAMDVAVLAAAGTVVHGSTTTAELCRRQGVSDARLVQVGDGDRISVGPFTVEVIESRHGIVPLASKIDVIELRGQGMPSTPFRWPRGAVFAYRVEFGGQSVHVQTSAGIADGPLARQAPADVLIACLAARQGTPHYLQRLGEQLRPKVLIACHHDNFLHPVDQRPRPVPRLDWPEFLESAAELRQKYGTRLVQLPRGVAVDF
ncbi:MBL fold metallo-hydrolase [Skermania sp. ID1734]|uniref:MBL fold metallo-hydrolase n=1 Tax=Skermania sp. ID1734 TaxID=2597516 RepID=UPI00117E0F40|nr:MBL fold metallo-hydrolase [Skermania sp. ID1734]TSE00684.1 MBL fold metallo-hydrolase [Skermania sp. ID1734]